MHHQRSEIDRRSVRVRLTQKDRSIRHIVAELFARHSDGLQSKGVLGSEGIEDIAIVGPIIKELMDVGIKNDDNLVKLATIYQRIMSKQTVDDSGVGLLTEEEKEQLMATLEDVTTDLQKKKDEIVDMSDIRSKYGKT